MHVSDARKKRNCRRRWRADCDGGNEDEGDRCGRLQKAVADEEGDIREVDLVSMMKSRVSADGVTSR